MAHRSQDMPAWRVVATALAAFAVGAQLLLSGLLVSHVAWAADPGDAPVICSHDPGALADVGEGTGVPAPTAHDPCPACACPQSAPAVALPAALAIAVLRPRSEALAVRPAILTAGHGFTSPYAPRAPPHSA